jgi:hypothetical protein
MRNLLIICQTGFERLHSFILCGLVFCSDDVCLGDNWYILLSLCLYPSFIWDGHFPLLIYPSIQRFLSSTS